MRRALLMSLALFLVAGKRAPALPPTFLEDGPVGTMNPLYPTCVSDTRAHALVYESLFFPNPDGGGWRSEVLESWSAEADGRLRLVIRKRLSWHDGERVSADDICATLTAFQHEETHAIAARIARRNPADCTPDDEDERVAWITLPEREPEPWRHLQLPLLPAHRLDGPIGPDDLKEPIGTGPYRATFDGRRWRFEDARQPHRQAPTPELRREHIVLPTARLAALRAGGAAALIVVPPEQLQEFRQDPAYTLHFYDRDRWTGILLNTAEGPLSDPRSREAVDLFIDPAALREQVVGIDPQRKEQSCVLLTGPGPHDGPGYNQGTPKPPVDPVGAKHLFGAPTPTLRLGIAPGADDGAALASAIVRQFAPQGVTIEVIPFDMQTWTSEVLAGTHSATLDLLIVTFEGRHGLDPWLHTRDGTRGVLQPFAAGHPSVDHALDRARSAPDRIGAARELHNILVDTRALIPLWEKDAWTAWKSSEFHHQPISRGDYFGQIHRWTTGP